MKRIDPVDFVQRELRFVEGDAFGTPFALREWQQDIVRDLFETDPETGLRRYRTALIGMPRKNGKSALAAAIALYLLVADNEPGAQVFSCAGDKEQARLVFSVAKRMVEQSPLLAAHCKVYRDAIEVPDTYSVYRVVSSDAPLKHGLNPSGVIFDEVHVQRDRELWDTMTTGSGTRRQPLIVGITTAGYDRASLCYQLYELGLKKEQGLVDLPSFYFRWIAAADDADWRDEAVWAAANPALGDFLDERFLRDAVGLTPEQVFRRLYLNQWTSSESRWVPMDVWDSCSGEANIAPGDEVFIAIDGAAKRDSTAVAIVAPRDDSTMDVQVRVFEPPDQQGGIIDPEQVENFIRDVFQTYHVVEGHFDPALFFRSAQILIDEGYELLEFPQSHSRMVPASQALFDAIMERRIRHGGDAKLREHADSAVARETGRGWRLDKERTAKGVRIDAVVALAMAVYAAEQVIDTRPSVELVL